jgi:hypothetical protein
MALVLVGVTVGGGRAGAATSTTLDTPVDRVLIISTPGVGWGAVNEIDTPNLWRLFQGSATGNLTARTYGRADLASGYLTLGAGVRATAPRTPLDGAGMEPDEPFGDVTARDAFALDTGRDQATGVLQLGIEPIRTANAEQKVDAVVGALGNDLAKAGRLRAVIGNGDGTYPDDDDTLKRFAINALMGSGGVVPEGRAGPELLEDAPNAPFGIRLDHDAVLDAFRASWSEGAVVMVEASDLVRADAFGLLATPEQGGAALRRAVKRTDELVGRLLAEVDLSRDAVVVVSPTRARGTVLSAVSLHAPGIPAGLLSSASTRRAGFVLLTDVAPTVLGLTGLPRDKTMTGSRFLVGPAASLTDRIDRLQDSTSAAVFRDDVRGPVTLVYALLQALLLGVAAYVLVRRRAAPRHGALVFAGLAVLAYVPAVFLARLLPLHEVGTPAYWAFLLVVSAALALLARAVARGDTANALLVVLAMIVGVLVLDVMTGARLQLSSAFGYSATIGIRVAGYGNIAYAILGGAAILLAALVAHRVGGRRGAVAGSLVMLVALVADVAPFWGSDVGGVLSMVPAFGVTIALLFGIRLRLTWRSVVIAGTATVLALAAVTAVDLSRPADARTHLGRLAQQVADEGIGPFTGTIGRKLDANLESWSSSEWRFVLLACVVFLVFLAVHERSRMGALLTSIPALGAALAGSAVLAVLGYAFNDSGIVVPGASLSIVSASLVVLLLGDVNPKHVTAGRTSRED